MKRKVWTPRAFHDLQAVRNFIEQDSPHYAELTVQRFFRGVERLPRFPESGRIVPEIQDPKVREVIIGPYRVVYRIMQDEAPHYYDSSCRPFFKLEI